MPGLRHAVDIFLFHPYCAECYTHNMTHRAKFRQQFSQSLDKAVQIANEASLPLLATETCWGSLNDTARAHQCAFALGELTKRGIGFCPQGLRYSKVADLHDYAGGPVGPPGYMAFLGPNRELRPGHDIYNQF